MRRFLKFSHTMGAIGMMGAMASLLVLLSFLPDPASIAEYTRMRTAMAAISSWIFLPSLVLTLAGGLLAMAATPAYHDRGWVLIKLATGILVFEGGLTAIDGPMGQEAALSREALVNGVRNASLGSSIHSEQVTLWVIMAVAVVNVVLGIWRPRFQQKRSSV